MKKFSKICLRCGSHTVESRNIISIDSGDVHWWLCIECDLFWMTDYDGNMSYWPTRHVGFIGGCVIVPGGSLLVIET